MVVILSCFPFNCLQWGKGYRHRVDNDSELSQYVRVEFFIEKTKKKLLLYSSKTRRQKSAPLLFKRRDVIPDFVKAKLIFIRHRKYQFGIKAREAADTNATKRG